jgi:hypothetical protein
VIRMARMQIRIATLISLILTLTTSAFADVQLPGIISDHMLLQRDMPVRIFGKASPGESVTVSFRGQTVRAVADPTGRWEAWLKPLGGGQPATMTVQGTNTITIADVLVGDVWIGSGQSNMQWAVWQSDNSDAEIAAAKFPQIRLFYVPRKTSSVPVEDVEARWVVCSPETIKDFSAVLYYFGRQMHQDLKTPMGLIHSSWGGTPHRLVAERSFAGQQPEARTVPDLLAERHPSISDQSESIRAGGQEMGSQRVAGRASSGAARTRPCARADVALQRDDCAADQVHDQRRALVSGRNRSWTRAGKHLR